MRIVRDGLPHFSIIADWVLEKGGIVYGAAFDGHMMLRHVGVEDAQALSELRGSKYLQSDGCDVYTQIRNQLKNGRWVYYTGTGCQVAGLRLFLRKPYPNLICSDLICHGTPSQKVFDWVVSEMERKYNGKIVKYQFRDKKVNGWSCSSSSSLVCLFEIAWLSVGIDNLRPIKRRNGEMEKRKVTVLSYFVRLPMSADKNLYTDITGIL